MGTLLSGGLDSSLVTSIAAKYTRDLTAFHVSVDGFPNLDERRHAEALTERFGLPLVSFSLTGEIFGASCPAWSISRTCHSPIRTPLPTT